MQGYLLAGGVDNVNYNGAIWYYANGKWQSLNLQNSSSVVSISANAQNDIFASGNDNMNNPTIWLFR